MKKRPRSPSLSPEPAPKKHHSKHAVSHLPEDVLALFSRGRERRSYYRDDEEDDFDDESDMEAGAFDQEAEERFRYVTPTVLFVIHSFLIFNSARMAKHEDEAALAELQRHDEEKRRKKAQRNRELFG
jgi:protein SPT2